MIRKNVSPATLSADIQAAVECLERGELILFPTETTYGLGADATNPAAIQRLMDYKTKRDNKPLSILVASPEQAEDFVELTATARQAYQAFLPGPVTVVSAGKHCVAPGVESPSGTLGIRISSHPVAQALAEAFGKPITATSANSSGQKRPYKIEDILENTTAQQQALISLALDLGTLPPNPPSTVIDTTLDSVQILRQGETLKKNTESKTLSDEKSSQAWGTQLARRFRSHYGYQPVVFALSGPMGVGKTHLTKGIAAGLGITETITSPSYTLLHEYEFTNEGQQIPLWHIDAWRLETAQELTELRVSDLFNQSGVLVLEWANLPQALLQAWPNLLVVSIQLAYGATEIERLAELSVIDSQI